MDRLHPLKQKVFTLAPVLPSCTC